MATKDTSAPRPPRSPCTPHGGVSVLAVTAIVTAVVLVVMATAIAGYRAGDASSGGDASPGTTSVPVTLKAQPIDTGFAADMNDHHDQAVQMSLLVVHRAESEAVRSIALDVATNQRRENGILQQFLRDRGITHVDPQREVMGWMGTPVPHDRMPGLATSEQLVALTNATGVDIDRLYIELMLRHHEGGVHMAEHARDHAESQDIRDLAGRMVVAQRREINELQQLQLGFAESP